MQVAIWISSWIAASKSAP